MLLGDRFLHPPGNALNDVQTDPPTYLCLDSDSHKMLVLYETAAGYALFRLADKAKLEERDMSVDFATPAAAAKVRPDP